MTERKMMSMVLVALVACSPSASGAGNEKQNGAATYELRYRFAADETVQYEVTHIAKTKTRLRGAEEVSQVHTVSQKVWKFQKSDQPDRMTFEHSVAKVELMQQTGEKPEVRWSSDSGSEPPVEFATVAEHLGTPLSTVSINPRGEEVDRTTHAGSESQLGMGGLTLSLPEEPIAVGGSWFVPREVKVRGESGEVKAMKVREVYTLEKVETGVATLSIRSEVLTPMEDESIKAQLVQQLSNGTIRFDVDGGRVLSKQLDWDETVVGFQGPNSMMEYRARLTETIAEPAVRTAKR
ncbi:MAG: hypothetical protein ACO1RT_03575 [Planctomycetaceae bacterium]